MDWRYAIRAEMEARPPLGNVPPMTRGQYWRHAIRTEQVVRIVAVQRRGVFAIELDEAWIQERAESPPRPNVLQIPLYHFLRDWQPAIYCEERERRRAKRQQRGLRFITVSTPRLFNGEWLKEHFDRPGLSIVDEPG